MGGGLGYPNIYTTKRSPQQADHFEVYIMGKFSQLFSFSPLEGQIPEAALVPRLLLYGSSVTRATPPPPPDQMGPEPLQQTPFPPPRPCWRKGGGTCRSLQLHNTSRQKHHHVTVSDRHVVKITPMSLLPCLLTDMMTAIRSCGFLWLLYISLSRGVGIGEGRCDLGVH